MSHHHQNHECSCHCHDHHHDSCCNCSCKNCSCNKHSCADSCEDSCHDFPKELLKMADCAWKELLKEKIKENMAKTAGNHLDEIAKVVVETNHARWQNKMAIQKAKQDFKNKLDSLFNCTSCKK